MGKGIGVEGGCGRDCMERGVGRDSREKEAGKG